MATPDAEDAVNVRNVAALETAVGYALFGPRLDLTADERDEARTIAIVLAARGVLAPSALSPAEILLLFPVRDYPPGPLPEEHSPYTLACIRDLERLAKGEP